MKNFNLAKQVVSVVLAMTLCMSMVPASALAELAPGTVPGIDSPDAGGAQGEPAASDAPQGASSAQEDAAKGDALHDTVTFDEQTGLYAVGLYGSMAADQAAATRALATELRAAGNPELVGNASASDIVGSLFAQEGAVSTQSTGNAPTIRSLALSWLSEDDVSDGDDARLTLKPSGNEQLGASSAAKGVAFQIRYSLESEADYDIGGLRIQIPKDMFTKRDGKATGKLGYDVLGDFKLVDEGDCYAISNTALMQGTSQGVLSLRVTGLLPYEIEDMHEHSFAVQFQVTNRLGKTAGPISSNTLTAVVDTHAVWTNLDYKHGYWYSSRATATPASDMPAEVRARYPDEADFVIVKWYYDSTRSSIDSNQPYDVTFSASRTSSDEQDWMFVGSSTSDLAGRGEFTQAYPLSKIRSMRSGFRSEIQVTGTLTPSDGKDPVSLATTSGDVRVEFEKEIEWRRAPKSPRDNTDLSVEGISGFDFTSSGTRSSTWEDGVNTLLRGDDLMGSYRIASAANDDAMLMVEGQSLGISQGRPLDIACGSDYNLARIGFKAGLGYWEQRRTVYPDGSADDWEYVEYNNFTIKCTGSYGLEKRPTLVLELQMDGSGTWIEYATADYGSGESSRDCAVTSHMGAEVSREGETTFVTFPASASNWRVRVENPDYVNGDAVWCQLTLDVRFNGNALKDKLVEGHSVDITYEALSYSGYGGRKAQETGTLVANWTKTDWSPKLTATGSASAYNSATDTIRLSYNASVAQNFSGTEATLSRAIADGRLKPEKQCTWYVLLPRHANPDLSSIRVSGASVTNAYVKRVAGRADGTWADGRVLVAVEADVADSQWKDNRTISIQADYDASAYDTVTNNIATVSQNAVFAYESGSDALGTVAGSQGEPNDPSGASGYNHSATQAALARERSSVVTALTGLSRGEVAATSATARTTPSFLYASAPTTPSWLVSMTSGIGKHASATGGAPFIKGTYTALTAYEGGMYAYRLRLSTDLVTTMSNMVLFDSLETYDTGAGDARWQGELAGVDVSDLEGLGCAPVVYYSTLPGLAIDAATADLNAEKDGQRIWVSASDYASAGGSLAAVKAVAVDCTTRADGSVFTMQRGQAASTYLRMKASAPEEVAAQRLVEQDAHAFNSCFVSAVMTVDGEAAPATPQLLENAYTKIGLQVTSLKVRLNWDDDNDRDGLRPGSARVALFANGQLWDPSTTPGYESCPASYVLNNANGWTCTFEHYPAVDANGTPITWSVCQVDDAGAKTVPAGYAYSATPFNGTSGTVTITDRHVPETIVFSGTKTWTAVEGYEDAEPGMRPSSIHVSLYADGEKQQTKSVGADASGEWAFAFSPAKKYRDHGVEIAYTVDEGPAEEGDLDDYIGRVQRVENADGTPSNTFAIQNTYKPTRDVVLTKALENATGASKGQRFTFTTTITAPVEDESGEGGAGEETPLFDDFAYDVLGDDGQPIAGRSGTVSMGKSFTIAGGESVIVRDLPKGATISVDERQASGWALLDAASDGRGAQTLSVQLKQALTNVQLTNRYETSTALNLRVSKALDGRPLIPGAFRFYLYDDATGDLEKIAMNRADGTVVFDALRYSNDDDGETYSYTVKERDLGKAGYTYADATYRAKVQVRDNGDGTMSAVPTWYAVDATTGAETPLAAGQVPTFTNTYRATGQVSLRAWKELNGGNLADYANEFSFELLAPVDGKQFDASDPTTYTVVQGAGADAADAASAKNQPAVADANGEATFLPLAFDQDALRLADGSGYADEATFTYYIREVAGANALVSYSSEVFGYTVTVQDNGDGTLSCSYEAIDGEQPVFTNTLKPGRLRLTKAVANPDDAPDDAEFTFRVALKNDKGSPVDLDLSAARAYARGNVTGEGSPLTVRTLGSGSPRAGVRAKTAAAGGESAAANAAGSVTAASTAESSLLTDPLGALAGAVAPEKAFAADGDFAGDAYAIYDTEQKVAVAFRAAAGTYTDGDTYSNVNIHGTTYSGKVLRLKDHKEHAFQGGGTHAVLKDTGITKVVFADKLKGDDDIWVSAMFGGAGELVAIEGIENLDTSGVQHFSQMFADCVKLSSISGVENLDYSSAISTVCMFRACQSLTELNLASADFSRVQFASAMFMACTSLTELSLGDFSNATGTVNIFQMFLGCESLQRIYATERTLTANKVTYLSYGASGFDPRLDCNPSWNNGGLCIRFNGRLISVDDSDGNTTNISPPNYYREAVDTLPFTPPFNPTQGYNVSAVFGAVKKRSANNYMGVACCNKLTGGNGSTYGDYYPLSSDDSDIRSVDNFPQCTIDFAGRHTVAAAVLGEQLTYARLDGGSDNPGFFTLASSNDYSLCYHANDGTDNTKTLSAQASADSAYADVSTFARNGYKLVGWATSASATTADYQPGQAIAADTYAASETAYDLYAVWEPAGGGKRVSDGVYEITMRGDTTVDLGEVAAGTSYQVYEETPSGWVLVGQSGASGTVAPTTTYEALFTNKYAPNETSAALSATKTLDGLPASGFTFQLVDANGGAADGTVLQEKAAAGGAVQFDPILYDASVAAGTYTYTVREVSGSDAAIAYDAHAETVTVTVSDDASGGRSSAVAYDADGAVFANATRTGTLSITKTVTGTTAADKDFTMQVRLRDAQGHLLTGEVAYRIDTAGAQGAPQVAAAANGVVEVALRAGQTAVFPSLPAGTAYSVAETALPAGYTLGSITGASSTVAPDADSAVVVANAYAATGMCYLDARKELSGRALKEGEFAFQLATDAGFADADVVATATNGTTGYVGFSAVQLDAAGTYTYYLRELPPGADADESVEYSQAVYRATVVAADNGDGTLAIGAPALELLSSDGSQPAQRVGQAMFQNAVKTGMLTVRTQLQGASAAAAARAVTYAVQLRDADGAALSGLEARIVGADGSTVRAFTLDSGAEVSLLPTESLEVLGVPYGSAYAVNGQPPSSFTRVAATGDAGSVTAAAPDALAVFTNRYDAFGQAQVTVQKSLAGRALAAGQFTFELRDESGAAVATATNDGQGKVSFPALGFTEADAGRTLAYTVVEADDGQPGYVYDTAPKQLAVTVADVQGEGSLACDVTYAGTATVSNRYTASGGISVPAVVRLDGSELHSGQFTFQVKDARGRVVGSATNDVDGNIVFDGLGFTEDDAGHTRTLYISQVVGNEPGFTYDTHVVDVAITVADAGGGRLTLSMPDDFEALFVNSYEEPTPEPQPGPAPAGSGTVRQEILPDNYGGARIDETDERLAEVLLMTSDEHARLSAGEDAVVWIEVTDVTGTLADDDKTRLHAVMNEGMTPGVFLDVRLYMRIGNSEPRQIHELSQPVSIRVKLSDRLLGEGRSYAVSREHFGEVARTDSIYAENVLTIIQDRFSVFEVAYADRAAASSASRSAGALPQTGDLIGFFALPVVICAVIAAAIVFAVVRRKLSSRQREEGE